jgi:hypothetical protein
MATYTDPYMFNLVLNSQNSSAFSNGTNDSTYLFNWTNIPQGKYQVSFSYRGLNNGDLVANDSPQVFISFPQTTTYQASTQEISQVSFFIGSLRIETHAGGQAYFACNQFDNPDIFLTSRPNGQIRVQVFRSDFITPFTTIAASNLADYVLVLGFKRIA